MRTLHILLLSLIFGSLFSQEIPEKEVKSEVDEVTVFLNGAQILRKESVSLPKGISMVKFVSLSPFIDARSIQVKAEGDLMVLSVNHQQNYLEKSEKSSELKDLEKKLEAIDDKIKTENTHIQIIQEELAFLNENRDLGGRNEQVSITNLQQAADFYSSKLTALKMKEIERTKTLQDLNKQKSDLQNQIRTLTSKKEYPSGEILVKVDAGVQRAFPMELSYVVGNAGWFPSYDIRAKNVNEPVRLSYKANVNQDTKVDWKDVTLRFSSADPNVSGVAPKLQPYYLSYNTMPPIYRMPTNTVRGRVTNGSGVPIPGAVVNVAGTTIGTVADQAGNYSITIPNSSSQLIYSSAGYGSQTLPVSGGTMNVALYENMVALEEVSSAAPAAQRRPSRPQARAEGMAVSDMGVNKGNLTSTAIPLARVENQTTVDFEIKTPYTIDSNAKNYTVDMETYDLPAFYQYYCVPKIDKDAFLIANIVEWEKYSLLEGEANVFFEDTYVGKTILDVRFASDTLEISLGRDKNVSVNREKTRDYTDKKLIGSKREETRAWKTTVKNNKNQEINMIVLDQVPVSTMEEIEVDVQDISGADHNTVTGEIKWEFNLKPMDTRELDLRYSVKYPKNKNLIVE